MSKHTPGPWVVQWQFFGGGNQRREVANTKDHCVATIDTFISNPGQSYEETVEANARLIAAAPELLEALKFSLAEWVQYEFCNEAGGPMERARQKAIKLAEDAIAKAEGK